MASAQTHLEKVATGGRGKFPGKFGEILHIPNGEIQNFPITKNPHFPIWRITHLLIGEIPYLPIGEILYVGISLFPHHCSQVPQWEY